MNLFDLTATLTLDTKDFAAKLEDAKRQLEQLAGAMNQSTGLDPEMADAVSRIFDEYEDKAKKAAEETKKLSDEMDSASKNGAPSFMEAVGKVGDKLADVGRQMQTIGDSMEKVFSPIGNVAKDAIDTAIEYESSLTGVWKTVDATAEQQEELNRFIRQYSTETASTKTEIAGAAEIVGQLTDEYANVIPLLKTIIPLSDSTNLTIDYAAKNLLGIMNVMQDGADVAADYGNVLVALGNNFNTDEKPILNMSSRLAGASKQLNMTGGETMALAAALSSLNIRAEAGGSSFSTIMSRMALAANQGLGPVQDVIDATGLSLHELQLLAANSPTDFRKMADSIDMPADKLKELINSGAYLEDFAKISGMSAEEFASAIQDDAYGAIVKFLEGLAQMDEGGESVYTALSDLDMTGIRVRDTLLRSKEGVELFTKAQQIAREEWENGSAMMDEAEKRYGTTESRIHQLKETLSNLTLEVGEKLMPLVERAMEWGYKIIDFLDQLPDGMLETIATVGLVGTAVGGLISNIGGVVSAAGTLIKAVGPFLSNGSVIVGIIAGLALLISSSDEFKASFEAITDRIAEKLPELIPQVVDAIMGIVEKITDPETLSLILDSGLDIILALTEGIIKAVPELIRAIPAIVENIVKFLIDASPKIFNGALELIAQLGAGLIAAIPELVTAVPYIIEAIVKGLISGVKDVMAVGPELMRGLIDGVQSMHTWLQEQLKKTVDNIVNFFKKLLGIHSPSTVFADIGKNLIQGLINGITNMAESIGTAISNVVSTITKAFTDLLKKPLQWGKDLIGNFTKGITDKIQSVKNTVSNVANTVKSFLGFSEPDMGPLSNFHTYAPDMMKLFAQGIRENERLVTDALEDSFDFSDKISAAFGGGVSGYGSSSQSISARNRGADSDRPIHIVVQSVLDGRVIGESTYKYARKKDLALGRT